MNSILIAKNIIKRVLRNRKEFIILLILPVLAVGLVNYMSNSPSNKVTSVAIANLDKGVFGNELVRLIEKDNTIKLINVDRASIESSVRSSKAQCSILIPQEFSFGISNKKGPDVIFYSKQNNMITIKLRQSINQYILSLNQFNLSANNISGKTGKSKNTILKSLFSQSDQGIQISDVNLAKAPGDDNTEVLLSSIGFALMFIMVLIFNTIGTIMEDKKKLILARISTFKLGEWQIATGNLLGGLTLGIFQLVPVTTALGIIYKIPVGIRLVELFIILLTFLVSVIGLGIGISGFIKSNFNPALIIATVIAPTCIIGGCFIPESMMPSIISKLGYFVPQKWTLIAIERIMHGGNIADIAGYLGIILMFGLVFSTFGIKALKPLNE